MNHHELHSRLQFTKDFLNKELVKNKLDPSSSVLSFREIDKKMDIIHEAERRGLRHLDDMGNRKLEKLVSEIESLRSVALN